MKIFPVHKRDLSGAIIAKEPPAESFSFIVHKFNVRPKPDPKDILFICSFSEFGCEAISIMYGIPYIQKLNPGKYLIVAGWFGREFLYRHLADEFWEIKEEFQWLRDFAGAFHNNSENIKKFENNLKKTYGKVYTSAELGFLMTGNSCAVCGSVWNGIAAYTKCPECNNTQIIKNPFVDVRESKKLARRVPQPSSEKMAWAKNFINSNKVIALFARGRKTYGRNLQPEFYIKLIKMLKDKEYDIVWLGEKQCTQACPIPGVIDFSRYPESRDLELTLAIIAQCRFTIQFYTASTRLASFVNVPYLIFESPDQILGNGHEGYRQELTTFTNKKEVYAHYLSVYDDNDAGVKLAERAVLEMENNDWSDIIGMVENPELIEGMLKDGLVRIGRKVRRQYA